VPVPALVTVFTHVATVVFIPENFALIDDDKLGGQFAVVSITAFGFAFSGLPSRTSTGGSLKISLGPLSPVHQISGGSAA
jgi:hypothetical protein